MYLFVGIIYKINFYLDQCQVPYLFFSTSLGTRSYNARGSSNTSNEFNDQENALFSFDTINKQLYTYTEVEKFTSYNLDGSDSATINVGNVEFFAVDGRIGLIYYYHELQEKISLYNLTSGRNAEVAALADVTSVKDLAIDVTNG